MSENFNKAKTRLLLGHPFFGSLLLQSRMIQDPKVAEIETNGVDIFYSDEVFATKTYQEIMGLLAHAVSHKLFLHTTRIGNRNPELWEKATDMAINPILKQSNFILPKDALMNPYGDDMSAEEIYVKLEQEDKQKQKQKGKGDAGQDEGQGQGQGKEQGESTPSDKPGSPGQPNHMRDKGKKLSPSEIKSREADIKAQVAQAAMQAKQAGKLPGFIEALVNQALKPKVDWKRALREFILETAKTDYTFKRPHRKMLVHDIYMPSMTGNEMPPFALVFDTSGSIFSSQKIVDTFVAEINGVIKDCLPSEVVVVYADTRVRHHQILEQGEELIPELKGGGGTAFSESFKWLDEHETDFAGIIYFTDLYVSDFGDTETPTMWAVYDNDNPEQPPFGQVVPIEI